MNALHLAEQATLGCLLIDPLAANVVSPWLHAEDFSHPWHNSVFAIIQERHADGRVVDPTNLGHALVERLGQRKADWPRIVDLLQAAPIHPNIQRYAAMVLEASLRREVACQGVLLQAAALSASMSEQSTPAAEAMSLVDACLQAAEDRWLIATSKCGAGGVRPADPRRQNRNHEAAIGADRLIQAHPPVDPEAVKENERRLVAALVSRPAHIATTAAWLRPESLCDPEWRPVYVALVQLSEMVEPIDVVTVAWEVRRAAGRHGQGPGTREFRDAVDLAIADEPRTLGRAVACDQLRRTANQAADALRAAADNSGIAMIDVLETGHLLTAAVRRTASVVTRGNPTDLDRRRIAAAPSLVPGRGVEPAGAYGPVAG